MHPVIGTCPICGDTLNVTRLHCRSCDTTIDGQFALGVFERLTSEQLVFVEMFIACEGKLNRLEGKLGLSYPTLRARLTELRHALGYQDEDEAPAGLTDDERSAILNDLAAGKVTSAEAMKMLQGG